MPDDFDTPLGREPARGRRDMPTAVMGGCIAALACVLVAFGGWVMLVDDPLGGEPVAVASARVPPPAETGGKQPASPPPAVTVREGGSAPRPSNEEEAPAGQTVTIIDGSSGARQTVAVGPAPQRREAAAAFDERLVESSRHGLLPKIADDGTRPSAAYASPRAAVAAAADGPKIAIVVGRLGVSAALTGEAFAKLPDSITLGFTPYGSDLGRWVAKARGEGREVLLQVPMEPFDYPDNDPGPQTLLATLPAEENIERLHGFMGAAQGYVGIANYMGARLAGHEPSMAAVLREAGQRGLVYFDDGTARGHAGALAAAAGVPFARADVVLDAASTAAEIDAALVRLETIARERGSAIGSAMALPVSVERIARWAKAAESRGITLAPISALAARAPSS